MNAVMDFQNVRAVKTCVLCGKKKDAGLVACWPCYRKSLKNGANAMTLTMLRDANRALRQRVAR
jgi:hypothetical protein